MQAFADLLSGTFTKQFSDTSSSSSSSKLAPRLVEASAHDYISRSLQQCHENRVVIYYWILNGGVVAFLAIIIGLYLYYASKKKLSPEEVRDKLLRENDLIMNQIRLYRDEQKRIDSLTGLPMANLKRGQEETNMRPMVFFD